MKLPYVQSGVQAQRWRFPLSRLPLGALCGWFREAEIYEASLCTTKRGTRPDAGAFHRVGCSAWSSLWVVQGGRNI